MPRLGTGPGWELDLSLGPFVLFVVQRPKCGKKLVLIRRDPLWTRKPASVELPGFLVA